MRNLLIVAAMLPVATLARAAPVDDVRVQLESALTASAAGWNAGDLPRFMAVYASDASFVGTKGLTQGKSAITERYRASFTSGANTRGRLTFATVATRRLSPVHVIYMGRWTLARANGETETGHTTLVFERRKPGWQIIADHSS